MEIVCRIFFLGALILFSGNLYPQVWKVYADSAKVAMDQKMPEKAITFFSKAKKTIPADSAFSDTNIRITKNMAGLYYSTGEYENAILMCRELMNETAKKYTEINADYAWACNVIGVINNNNGKLDTAEIFYLKSKDIREKLFGGNERNYAQSCNNLGALYHDLGKYDLAEPLLLEARAIRENIEPAKKAPVYAITCVALANLYRDMGQYEKAESLYLEAKNIRSFAGKMNADYANSCNILADLYYYMQEYQKAESLYLEAKDIRAELDSGGFEYGQSCNNLANVYKDMMQYQKAESLAIEAKIIFEKDTSEGPSSRTINLNNLGELYYAMGKYKEAEYYLLQARKLWQVNLGKNHPFLITNSEELAMVYWNMNQTEKAEKLFAEASRLKYEQLSKIFQFTSESEKQLYLQNINGSSDEYQSFYYKKLPRNNAAPSYAMSLLNRNLILSSAQQAKQIIYNSGDTALAKAYKEWTNVNAHLAKLYAKGTTLNSLPVKELEEKANNIEKELFRKSAALKNVQKKISWQDIQKNLKENEAAIEYVHFQLDDGRVWTDSILYVALILKKNKEPLLVPLFEEKQLNLLLASPSLNEEEDINRLYSSPALYNLVWRPVEKYLTGIQKVYFAPAGNLFRISFGAMAVNDKQVLNDKVQLIQLNTTATITSQSPDYISSSDKIKLYGGIQYDADTAALKASVIAYHNGNEKLRSLPEEIRGGKNLTYLPGTLQEVNEIKNQAIKNDPNVSLLTGTEATEESLKELNGPSSPAILHIATHGFFFPDPGIDKRDSVQQKFEISGKAFRQSANPLMRSGLFFAGANSAWRGHTIDGIDDGIVTAYEISTTMYLPKTKLVVLSACETALGDIQGSEGVYGLQRAFKMAGVKNLVMSLWKVPDDETSDFMNSFYRSLLNRQSVNEAFYRAQENMKNKYRNDPYKWAAWVLVK